MKAFNELREKMGAKISSVWGNLDEKDRRTLALAAPVVVLLLLYLIVFQPIQTRYNEARHYKNELSDTLVWLYENAALVERLQNACTRQRQVEQGGDDLIQFARDIGRKAGVSAEFRTTSDGDLMASIKSAPGNRALSSVQSFACNGYIISDLKLVRKDETATEVDLSFKLAASSVIGGS